MRQLLNIPGSLCVVFEKPYGVLENIPDSKMLYISDISNFVDETTHTDKKYIPIIKE